MRRPPFPFEPSTLSLQPRGIERRKRWLNQAANPHQVIRNLPALKRLAKPNVCDIGDCGAKHSTSKDRRDPLPDVDDRRY